MSKYAIDYRSVAAAYLNRPKTAQLQQPRTFYNHLMNELPERWYQTYRRMPNGRVDIVRLTDQGYEFLFDLGAERVVAAFGTSRFNPEKRDSTRMKGFLGSDYRARFFAAHGDKYDRGHFMSHRQGGGLDINLFPQLADINQGHSTLGKIYRAMENACVAQNGVFCFSRPIYDDRTWVPAALEYGIIYGPKAPDIRTFPNR